jgi:DNA replication protein DnaC
MATRDADLHELLALLKLSALNDVVIQELERAQKTQPSYTAFYTSMLRAQYELIRERALKSRIRAAKFPEVWTLETFPFDKQPGVHAPSIRELGELDFIARKENIVLIGLTGVGKTGLASGILLKAVEHGYRGLFIKAHDLFEEMYASIADRSSKRLLTRLINLDILLIDEMGYLSLKPEQTNMFFKLMHERYSRGATLITTNLEYDAWHDFLGRKEMVSALLSRLRHHCHTIKIDGPSLRSPTRTP